MGAAESHEIAVARNGFGLEHKTSENSQIVLVGR